MAVTRRRTSDDVSKARLFDFGGVGGGNQPARHLDAGGFGFGFPDQTGGSVALDLVQLVAIDSDVAAGAQGLAPRQGPEHGEDRRRRHQCISRAKVSLNPTTS